MGDDPTVSQHEIGSATQLSWGTIVAAFNQEKALVGAFSVIAQPVVEPMDRIAALVQGPCVRHNIQLFTWHYLHV